MTIKYNRLDFFFFFEVSKNITAIYLQLHRTREHGSNKVDNQILNMVLEAIYLMIHKIVSELIVHICSNYGI